MKINDNNHVRTEAERIMADDIRILGHGAGLWDRLMDPEEIVCSQPEELYRPPPYLSRTASDAEVKEIRELLHFLWEINEQHVGEKAFTVGVYYGITGESDWLQEAFRLWSDSYFRKRADPARLNPQVQNDPFLLFAKVVGEYENFLGKLGRLPHSVNFQFLNLTALYVPWLLYQILWRGLAWVEGIGTKHECVFFADCSPSNPAQAASIVHECLTTRDWMDAHLPSVLSGVRQSGPFHRLTALTTRSDGSLRTGLTNMAADLQEMRPLLAPRYKVRKTVVSLGEGLAACWCWSSRSGVADIVVKDSVEAAVRAAELGRASLIVGVRRDGLLSEYSRPWETSGDLPAEEGVSPLALNYHVLSCFHELFLSHYDQVDFSRIRGRTGIPDRASPDKEGGICPSGPGDQELEALAVSCHDLEAREGASEEAAPGLGLKRRPLRALRSPRAFKLLRESFGCEVTQGKGSEVTIYRSGGHKFILGHHGQCVTVGPLLLQRLLQRLGITTEEWLDAVYG